GTTAQARIVITSDQPLPGGAINLASLLLDTPIGDDSRAGLLDVAVEDINGAASLGSVIMSDLKLQIPESETETVSEPVGQGLADNWRMNFSTDELDQNPNARIRLAIRPEATSDAAITKDEDALIDVIDTVDLDAAGPINDFRIAIPEIETAESIQSPIGMSN